MKATVLFCFCLALAGTLTEVQCLRKRPRRPPSPTRPRVKMGWSLNDGRCICSNTTTGPGLRWDQGQMSHQGHMGPSPTGHHGSHGPRPTGHHGSHGPRPIGHHGPHSGPRPTGHHGHHGPHRPTGHHGHHGPHSGPRPTGHHGHHGPHSGPRPTGHHGHHGPHSGPRPTGHHGHHGPHSGPKPSGHHGPRPTGHHSRYTRCVCRRQSERTANIRFRMKETWDKALSDFKSMSYRIKSNYILKKLVNVLKIAKSRFTKMRFSQGSVVVQVGAVYEVPKSGSIVEDPEKALRDAILSGEMKDMNVYPDSLVVEDTYSGVTLSEWSASEHDCSLMCPRRGKHHRGKHGRKHERGKRDNDKHGDRHHHQHHVVRQTRTCTEIDASCDGIPLTRNASCEEACHMRPRTVSCWGWRTSGKFIVIICLAAVVVLVIVVVATIATVKKSRKKYIKSSPSTSSIKELAKNDELQFQSKC